MVRPTTPSTTGDMNIIAGFIGGIIGTVMALTVRLIITHPMVCTVGVCAVIALARGVPGLVVFGALAVIAVIGYARRGD